MNVYKELESAKYWQESINRRVKDEKKAKRAEFRKAFFQISALYFSMGVVVLTMPIWIPALIRYLDWAA